jgi:hypothetical protein
MKISNNIFLILIILMIIFQVIVILTIIKKSKNKQRYNTVIDTKIDTQVVTQVIHNDQHEQLDDTKTSSKKNLLPIMNPNQNLHDVVKQIILLEQHLFDPQRRCNDCIKKHFLTIEALLEETYSLICKNRKLTKEVNIQKLLESFKELHLEWFDHKDDNDYIQSMTCKIRYLRKDLMEDYGLPIITKKT